MPDKFNKLSYSLFSAENGGIAHDVLKEIWPNKVKLEPQARAILIQYAKEGKLGQVRAYVVGRLSHIAEPDASDLAALFLDGLNDGELRFWSIEGAAKVHGKKVYPELCNIALNESCRLEERAHAVQYLARLSRQPFFTGLGSDPGHWQAEELKFDDIIAWRDNGFPDGTGGQKPEVDPALKTPHTAIEKAAAKFESKLSKFRTADQDNSINPCNYLCPGSLSAVEQIEERCRLPKNYREFLLRFSPFNITAYLYVPGMRPNFTFYTAEKLLDSQRMFTHTGENRDPEWPSNFLAIGDCWCNPVVLDLSKSNGQDAPLLWADHDEVPWQFKSCSKSFTSFLERLTVTDQWRDPSEDPVAEALYHLTTFGKHLGERG